MIKQRLPVHQTILESIKPIPTPSKTNDYKKVKKKRNEWIKRKIQRIGEESEDSLKNREIEILNKSD